MSLLFNQKKGIVVEKQDSNKRIDEIIHMNVDFLNFL